MPQAWLGSPICESNALTINFRHTTLSHYIFHAAECAEFKLTDRRAMKHGRAHSRVKPQEISAGFQPVKHIRFGGGRSYGLKHIGLISHRVLKKF